MRQLLCETSIIRSKITIMRIIDYFSIKEFLIFFFFFMIKIIVEFTIVSNNLRLLLISKFTDSLQIMQIMQNKINKLI